jgi:hypothetical protein
MASLSTKDLRRRIDGFSVVNEATLSLIVKAPRDYREENEQRPD